MAEDFDEWERVALEIYRDTWSTLSALQIAGREDLEIWVDELKEALLDLKQATIQMDSTRAAGHIEEISLLLVELRLRYKEE